MTATTAPGSTPNPGIPQLAARRLPSLFSGALSNWLPLGTSVITALVLTPFLLAQLGKKDYGVWSLTLSFVGYYGLMQLSVGSGIMRYVPFYEGREDSETACQVVSTGLAMFTVVGLMILLISEVLAGPLSRFYHGGSDLEMLIRLTGLAAAIECPTRIFDATLRAREKWIVANIISAGNGIMYALSLATSLLVGGGLIGMGLALILSDTITMLASVVAVRRNCPEIHLSPLLVRWLLLRELLGFGVLTVVGTAAYSMVLQNHKLIVGKLVSLEAVAVYAIATQFIERVRGIVWAPLQVAWPRFALLDGQKNYEQVRELHRQTTRYSAMLSSGGILLLMVAGPPFVALWLGKGFEASSALLLILGLGCLVESTLYGNSCFLGGTGRQNIVARFACVEAVFGLGLSLLLGWKLGMLGVAWGYTVFVILIRGLACTRYVCKLIQVDQLNYYRRTLFRPWLMLGVIVLAAQLLEVPCHASTWISWFVLVFALASLYALLTWVCVLNRDEKKWVLDKVQILPLRVQRLMTAQKGTE